MFCWSHEWFLKDLEKATLAMLEMDRREKAKKEKANG